MFLELLRRELLIMIETELCFSFSDPGSEGAHVISLLKWKCGVRGTPSTPAGQKGSKQQGYSGAGEGDRRSSAHS